MTRYIGCEYARERLEALVDGELSVDEQVEVESHVRWCRTCVARIEDFRLIGAAVRGGSLERAPQPDLEGMRAGVEMRLRTEGEQALVVRVREMFADSRLVWPALGATCAFAVSVAVALGVLHGTSSVRPESLAMMIEAVGNPGSELNPLSPDNRARVDPFFAKYVDSDRAGGISMPRVAGDGRGLAAMPTPEAMFTMATVVSREGRIANYAVLNGSTAAPALFGGVRVQAVEAALDDAVRQSRFAPAQTSLGRTVAVNMVWLIYYTTVQVPPLEDDHQGVVDVTPGEPVGVSPVA